jgi:FkbM family methyltransferase
MPTVRRIFSTARWQRLRLQVLERDGYRCHRCGGPATEVDHIRALVLGGQPYDPANLVASCKRCNSRRGRELQHAGLAGWLPLERVRAGAIRLSSSLAAAASQAQSSYVWIGSCPGTAPGMRVVAKGLREAARLVGLADALPAAGRLRARRAQAQLFEADDDVLVRGLEERLQLRDGGGVDVIANLVGRLPKHAAEGLAERITPVGELDYDKHHIELLVSSPPARRRLRSVEKEPFTVDWIERSIRQGDVFYDIGANVGAYALIAAKATGNGARTFAFEPSIASFHDLARNVARNHCAGSVVPLQLALWDETRLLSMELRSRHAGAALHRIGSRASSRATNVQQTLGVRIDDLVEQVGLPAPTHAKIDVDGYELNVLRGALSTLRGGTWRSIIVELDRDDTRRNREIKDLLTSVGFDGGRRHAYPPSRRYPRPEERSTAYWTFERRVS